jgi:hypothetical protein
MGRGEDKLAEVLAENRRELKAMIAKAFEESGRAGGKARAANMTKKARSESARKAAQAQWKKAKGKVAK